jgi:hypothetical protein
MHYSHLVGIVYEDIAAALTWTSDKAFSEPEIFTTCSCSADAPALPPSQPLKGHLSTHLTSAASLSPAC